MTYRRTVELICDGGFTDDPCRMGFRSSHYSQSVTQARSQASSLGWIAVDVDSTTTEDYCPRHALQVRGKGLVKRMVDEEQTT